MSAVHASPATSPSPSAVHALVCEFVTAQAQSEGGHGGGWAGYRDVFLSAEVQDLIRLRLQDEEGATAVEVAGDGALTKKKRKLDASSPAAAVDPDVSWTICSMDGATLSVAVPEDAPVAELKRAIGVLHEVPCFTIELFMKDVEEALADETPLRSLGRVPLFLLLKQASDRLALESFFKSCGGAGWERKGGWMTEAELGEWEGVTVDAEGRVIMLRLPNNGLVGCIPSDIQQLSALEVLNLSNDPGERHKNELVGPIPAALGRLRALTHLFLDGNRLSGAIPAELGQLAALEKLHLNENELSGPIPAALGQLGALTGLFLDRNQLSGPIPAELRQLGALAELDLFERGGISLYSNQLTGQEAFGAYMEEHHPDCMLQM
jgi:Leucine-rich repeat (LRR) protein